MKSKPQKKLTFSEWFNEMQAKLEHLERTDKVGYPVEQSLKLMRIRGGHPVLSQLP